MKSKVTRYILLTLLVLVILYFIVVARVLLLTQGLNGEDRISNSQDNITISIPKQARVGDEIKVVVYYYPNLFKLFNKNQLRQIIFSDNNNAHSDKNSLNLSENKKENSHTVGLLPYYETFSFKIPQQVCPKSIVYETCQLVTTKTGKGTIKLIYEPTKSNFYGGEGYQGDGESIDVPINIVNK